MFTFYKTKVTENDWTIVFNHDDKITKINNDKEGLIALLSGVNYLVGFNNYSYDDKIIASILKNISAYETHQKLISGKRFNLSLNNPITLDASQELGNLTLDEAQANEGLDLNSLAMTDDVLFIKSIFEKRESYFASKFEIVKEFKLPATSVKKTRANLASEVLKARPANDNERLHITYDKRLPKHELPEQITKFYEGIESEYRNGISYESLEKRKLTYKLAGIEHIYGFGGLHAAKENYQGEGSFMQIDIGSYYPSLIINNGFIAEQSMDSFKKIYHTRQQLKLSKDDKEEVYKIILNATYGSLKSKWSKLYNPKMANNIVVNGQLILTHLICLLEGHCELIQTNTDGIIIKYEKGFERNVIKLLELFEKAYDLNFDVDPITKIAQRDVNNYVLLYENGTIKAKGRFANYEGGSYERSSLTVIDKALVDYYTKGIKPNQTVVKLWKANQLHYFQLVKKSGKFDGMAQEVKENTLLEGNYRSEFEQLGDTNRLFSTNDKYLGGIFFTKNNKEMRYSKVPYTSENVLVWKGDIKQLDKRKINLNWYIKEIEKWLF